MSDIEDQVLSRGKWRLKAYDKYGQLVHADNWHNIVTNEGLDYLLSAGLADGAKQSSWYLGLTGGGPSAAAGDTMGGHGGWSEVSDYTGDRKAWTPGDVSGQSVSNSGSLAQFEINANGATIGGAFLTSEASGNSGTLYAIGAFNGGDITLNDGSTLEIEATFSTSAS